MKSRTKDLAKIYLFLVALLVPGVVGLLGLSGSDLDENRRAAAFPSVEGSESWDEWRSGFERYLADRIAFRSWWIESRSRLYFELFDQSPTSRVLLGEDGWMFLASPNKLEYFHRLDPVAGPALNGWRRRARANRSFVEERGAKYSLLVAPNKESVYPQFMPAGYRRIGEERRVETIARALEGDVVVVDPTQALVELSTQRQVYAKTDVHWNGLGAFVAYRELMRRVQQWYPDVEAIELEDLVEYEEPGDFDLMRQAALEWASTETWKMLRPEGGWQSNFRVPNQRIRGLTLGGQPFYSEHPAGYPLHVLVLHDSFGQQMKPYLAETFERTSFLHHRYYSARGVQGETMAEIIERLRPDIVVHQATERIFAFGANALHDYSQGRAP